MNVQDIPGATPGSLKSKVLRNHEMAEKIRLAHTVQPDSLDRFRVQYQKVKDPLEDPFWKDYQGQQQKLDFGRQVQTLS